MCVYSLCVCVCVCVCVNMCAFKCVYRNQVNMSNLKAPFAVH